MTNHFKFLSSKHVDVCISWIIFLCGVLLHFEPYFQCVMLYCFTHIPDRKDSREFSSWQVVTCYFLLYDVIIAFDE